MFYFRIKEFCSILCIFGKTWLYIVWHDFNLTYYSSIILGSFSILLFPKLCWHIGLTPTQLSIILYNYLIYNCLIYLCTFMSSYNFHAISNNEIIYYMDTLATIYDKMHVIEYSGATLLLGFSLQTPTSEILSAALLSQQVLHLPIYIVTVLS